MQRTQTRALSVLMLGVLAAVPAWADKPSWAGEPGQRHERGDQGDGYGERDRHEQRAGDERRDGHFSEQNRDFIRRYYADQFRGGHCPPGLAKKRNGCLPPGQAKKWKLGETLPRDVAYYDLPPRVVAQLGPPPAGHRYVRVASDILLIAVGTGMVVDAIEDLGRQ